MAWTSRIDNASNEKPMLGVGGSEEEKEGLDKPTEHGVDNAVEDGKEYQAAITQVRKDNEEECITQVVKSYDGQPICQEESQYHGSERALIGNDGIVIQDCQYDKECDIQFMTNGEEEMCDKHKRYSEAGACDNVELYDKVNGDIDDRPAPPLVDEVSWQPPLNLDDVLKQSIAECDLPCNEDVGCNEDAPCMQGTPCPSSSKEPGTSIINRVAINNVCKRRLAEELFQGIHTDSEFNFDP
ncbi:uncharacterized protein LOC120841815 isoform X2 [Ixodes scapularis]|nr:uncharacterized protein LOC120841815 isoform X2 [Ixodes scapularis]